MPLKWWHVLLAGVIATASMDVLTAIAVRQQSGQSCLFWIRYLDRCPDHLAHMITSSTDRIPP